MKITRWFAGVGLCACSLCAAAQTGVEVTDDSGSLVRLARPAARIVSLSPHATELLFAAGAGARVVGAVAYSDYPPEAAKIPRVGDAHALDLERILALRPDLVVAWRSGNSAAQVDKLARAGVPVFQSEPRRLEDIATSLRRLGRLAGTEAASDSAERRFRFSLEAFTRAHAGAERVSVFYEIWHEPIMTLNGQHFVSDLLSRCGARNVFADAPALVATVGLEEVIAAAPQALATGAGAPALDFWRARRELPAARSGRICPADPERMHRATPRALDAARELCACLRGG